MKDRAKRETEGAKHEVGLSVRQRAKHERKLSEEAQERAKHERELSTREPSMGERAKRAHQH